VRRLALILIVVAVMAATMIGGASAASAQPGPWGPVYCGPWHESWHISESGWWYVWNWRWCHHPFWGGWYVDWAGWNWDGRAR
jgi:hypothetical protein